MTSTLVGVRTRSSVGGGIAVVGAAALVAVAAQRSLIAGIALALLPALVLLVPRPVVAAVIGVALVPITASVVPAGPLRVSASDALLLLALLAGLGVAQRQDWAPVKPLVPVIAFYGLTLLPALSARVEPGGLINAAQRLQIVIVPLLVGAVVLRRSGLSAALHLYVLVSCLLGVLFGLGLLPGQLEAQKNPVGQFVAGYAPRCR